MPNVIPERPNPIASSVCQVKDIDYNKGIVLLNTFLTRRSVYGKSKYPTD